MKKATPIILLLFTLSGLSGLVYEFVWIRLLSHLLGGTTFAISTVLAAFMGGLALGSRYFGPRADRALRPLRLYAYMEIGIAVLGAALTPLILLARPLYISLAHTLPDSGLAVLRVAATLALLLPPTFLMGGTLPVLSRFVVRSHGRLGRGLGLLYAVNTFGAVLGAFLAGFVLIPSLGLILCTVAAVGGNLLIAAATLLVDRGLDESDLASAAGELIDDGQEALRPDRPRETDSATDLANRNRTMELAPWVLASIFALSGFVSMGNEVYWTRALHHFLGNSTYAFSAMLTTFLLGLAAGGYLGGRAADRVTSPSSLLGWTQIGVGVTVLLSAILIRNWLPVLENAAFLGSRNLDWTSYLSRRFLIAFSVMAIPTFLTGMSFPLVNRIGIQSLSSLGRGVGWLYFANTMGAIAGSLAAGFLLLPLLGAHKALLLSALLSGLVGMAAHLGRFQIRTRDLWSAGALVLLLMATLPLAASLGTGPLSDSQASEDEVLFDRIDATAQTRVYRKATGELHMSVDGHHIGGTESSIVRKEKILAHLPMALVPQARKTLSIGLGSGVTLGALALYDEIESLDCVEIVPGVVAGARFFNKWNENVLGDPRTKIHVGDGVQFLLTCQDSFDIISSDSKLNPEYSGNAPLLSRDYYELCRERLTDSGVMVQWIALHLPASEVRIIARSFTAAFPHAGLFWFDPYNLVFVGSRRPLEMDLARGRAQREEPDLLADLSSLLIADVELPPSLFITDRDGLIDALGPGTVNTWLRPVLEFSMVRAFRSKGRAYHEDENLVWLRRLADQTRLTVTGVEDQGKLAAAREATSHLLAGYAAGGGISRLESGREDFVRGLAARPGDERLNLLLAALDQVREKVRDQADAETATAEDRVRLALDHMEADRHDLALALLDAALLEIPDEPNIEYNRLLCLRELGKEASFTSDLVRFRHAYPRDARGLNLHGRQLATQGKLAEAEEVFRQAVEQDPGGAMYLNNLATLLARRENYAAAGDTFAKLHAMNPFYPQVAYFAAASYSMAGQADKSARFARICLEKTPKRLAEFEKGELFINLRSSAHWPLAD